MKVKTGCYTVPITFIYADKLHVQTIYTVLLCIS